VKHLFVPWGYALRALVLRAPEGPRTPNVPVAAPSGLEPPEPLADAQNGYRRLVELVEGWPYEGPFPPDLNHWRRSLPAERVAAERALAPLRPLLERTDVALGSDAWQSPVPENGGFPELAKVRRFAQALLLRGALERRSDDRERAVEIARRLRRSQGPFMHYLVGVAIEKMAEGPFDGVDEDRAAAVRWELARFAVPRAHRLGPWEPVDYELPPQWADAQRGVRWALVGHALPYDPAALVAMLVAERDRMASGSSTEIQARAEEIAAPWPRSMIPVGGFGPASSSLADLRRARLALREVANPYGRLSAAQTLRAAASLTRATEKARDA